MDVSSIEWKLELKKEACDLGFPLDFDQIDLLAVFIHELLSFNARFNITSIQDPHELIAKHILDSFIPSRFIPEHSMVLDIGTGGGFPGIPLKIINPSLSLILIDGSRKKINFVKYIIRTLKLTNIKAMHTRAERLSLHEEFQKKFDVIVSRAVTSLKQLIPLASPLVNDNGMIIAMKGERETTDAELLNLEKHTDTFQGPIQSQEFKIRVKTYQIPNHYNDRCIVIMQKNN